jgi:hypothetical protein
MMLLKLFVGSDTLAHKRFRRVMLRTKWKAGKSEIGGKGGKILWGRAGGNKKVGGG